MPAGEALDDDYVISLLTRDAEANKKRYLTNGLGSLLSKRPSGNAPKPNTRFLRNIIRDTDAHNAALKAKEEEESRARLRDLRRGGSSGKRARVEDGAEREGKRRKGDARPGRWGSVLEGLGEKGRRGETKRESKDVVKDEERSTLKHERQRSHETRHDDTRRRSRHEQRSTIKRQPDTESRNVRRRRSEYSRSPSRSPSPHRAAGAFEHGRFGTQEEEDSGSADETIGPEPPPKVRPRGRGADKPPSSIDSRFKPSYDPKTDVDLDSDNGGRDDWDMALEAMRDRAKWQSKRGERLRAAGFSEDEVTKWEKTNSLLGADEGGGEKDVEEVRWRKKGEGREWDRGKVFGDDGGVEVKADWGRLKGS